MSAAASIPRILVIGVGNLDRGDDAIGPLVARRIKQFAPPGVTVIEQCCDAADMIERWTGAAAVIAIDAVMSDHHAAGTILRFDVAQDPLPIAIFAHHSTHCFGLAQAVELSRALGVLPWQFVVYGVVANRFTPGEDLCDQLSEPLNMLSRRILADLSALSRMSVGALVNSGNSGKKVARSLEV